ncbi:hypothetical protein QFC21_004879 [Naganishia friedmannii]|uniref:Uncharacterized protein n=1 Tax=Naganishia friedmannii TaxID=89922 RepID=A0ACC2VCU4_9TREE|nr:hypothetical protein QFC21_004879 [Naganishia friedmannii]
MSGYANPYQQGHDQEAQTVPAARHQYTDSNSYPARPGSQFIAGDSYSTYDDDKPVASHHHAPADPSRVSIADHRRSVLPKTAPRGSRYFTGERGNPERPMSQWTVGIEPPPKSTGMLRMWRKENRAGWVEWVRPPDINLNGVTMPTNALQINAANSSLSINFDLAIRQVLTVSSDFPGEQRQPKFKEISAVFGGGSLSDVKFPANTLTNVTFPFALQYTSAMDPDGTVLQDIVYLTDFSRLAPEAKCTNKQQIKINYDLTLKLQIAGISISPKISNSANIDCPVDDLSALSLTWILPVCAGIGTAW